MMGLFDLFSKPGDAAFHEAQEALNSHSEQERQAGVTEDTDEYLRLNQAVHDAKVHASWWARFDR